MARFADFSAFFAFLYHFALSISAFFTLSTSVHFQSCCPKSSLLVALWRSSVAFYLPIPVVLGIKRQNILFELPTQFTVPMTRITSKY